VAERCVRVVGGEAGDVAAFIRREVVGESGSGDSGRDVGDKTG
jgi:hypothetical protein